MKLSSIRIRRYRCILDLTLQVGSLTGLIGMNGSGKSAILRALAAFYGQGEPIQPEDWYGADTAQEIEVALTFADLADDERESLSHYVGPDGQLQVARVWRLEEGHVRDSLHGYHLAEPDFDVVRQADKAIAALHNDLADSGKYPGLERISAAPEAEDALQRWEASHQERCRWVRDNGKFFGWNQVGRARLEAASVCVYVPAVREAREDAAEGKGSALSKIVDLVLREKLRRDSDLVELRKTTEERFRNILAKTRPALGGLAGELSDLMAEFVPGSAVSLDWREGSPALPDWPSIEARLSEDGVETPVWAKGHGLQRSFIVSLLQRLAELRAHGVAQDEGMTSTVTTRHTLLLVEEPELYQ
jgi:putative ATP-dependent endonuclease of OLD family